MNVSTFAGRVGGDAELTYTKSGMAVASFSLAIDNGKGKDGEKKPATWIKATLWDKRAESLAQYIKKGSFVIVSGPVSIETWLSKTEGTAQGKIVVSVNQFTFGGDSKSNQSDNTQQEAQASPRAAAQNNSTITDDDIPF